MYSLDMVSVEDPKDTKPKSEGPVLIPCANEPGVMDGLRRDVVKKPQNKPAVLPARPLC